MLRSCLTVIASVVVVRFGILSQIGSTSGPSRSPAPSQPQHQTVTESARPAAELGQRRTILWPALERELVALLRDEQTVVGAEPRAVLRVRAGVVREAAEADVAADGGEVAACGVDDVEHLLVVRELDARDHDDAPVAARPVVVPDERALARGALALDEARHAEAHVRRRVDRRRVEHRDPVPAGLHLDREVVLEAHRRAVVVEDRLERRVLERGAVDVACDPVVVEHRRALGSVSVAQGGGRTRTISSWNM